MPNETYNKHLLFKSALCVKCEQIIGTTAIEALTSYTEVSTLAENKHREAFGLASKIPDTNPDVKRCVDPVLIIEYATALINGRAKAAITPTAPPALIESVH